MIHGDAPRMQLAPQGIGAGRVYVSEEFRAEINAWMLDFSGTVDGLKMRNNTVMAECRSCGNDCEWPCDPIEGFDPAMSYCGRSPRCCP